MGNEAKLMDAIRSLGPYFGVASDIDTVKFALLGKDPAELALLSGDITSPYIFPDWDPGSHAPAPNTEPNAVVTPSAQDLYFQVIGQIINITDGGMKMEDVIKSVEQYMSGALKDLQAAAIRNFENPQNQFSDKLEGTACGEA